VVIGTQERLNGLGSLAEVLYGDMQLLNPVGFGARLMCVQKGEVS
jgi:hypothetical protein